MTDKLLDIEAGVFVVFLTWGETKYYHSTNKEVGDGYDEP
jgi:hypothetical protein